MSRNVPASEPAVDRRVRRTRERLGDALVELIQQKPFQEITVQEVLDRAEVGRSTFYTHFRDKNDLFQTDMDEFLEQMAMALSRAGDASDRVAPVRELFAHVAEMRPLRDALAASGRLEDFMELARGHFARGIERRLAEHPRAAGIGQIQRAAVAHAWAGALLSLLTWWLDRDTPVSPEQMDRLYHGLVWGGVGS